MKLKGMILALSGVLIPVIVVAAIAADPKQEGEEKPRNVTVTGRVVDLHSYMTGKFASSDPIRSTRANIQAGVPAAVEVPDGVILVGQGTKDSRKILARLAHQKVELKGRLYERGGLRYIDMSDAKPVKDTQEPNGAQRGYPDHVEPDSEDSDEPEPSVQGACCLPEGDCIDSDEEGCAKASGEFHLGAVCGEIDCDPRCP